MQTAKHYGCFMSIPPPEIILALDLEDRAQINQVLKSTGDRLTWVKVGLQSYLRDGVSLVKELADSGKKVFLDLKLHDIPNTMEKALESLAGLPVGMITCRFQNLIDLSSVFEIEGQNNFRGGYAHKTPIMLGCLHEPIQFLYRTCFFSTL